MHLDVDVIVINYFCVDFEVKKVGVNRHFVTFSVVFLHGEVILPGMISRC